MLAIDHKTGKTVWRHDFYDTIRDLFTEAPLSKERVSTLQKSKHTVYIGEIVATGTPEQIAASKRSYTGKFLKAHLR